MVNVIDKLKAEGRCRLCERESRGVGGRELTRHRLVPGRFGGRYEYANVVPLCNPCHIDVEAQDPVARRMLRPKLWSIEVNHVLGEMGQSWLELMYPRPSGPGVSFREADELAAPRAARNADARRPRPAPNSWTFADALARSKREALYDLASESEKSLARERR